MSALRLLLIAVFLAYAGGAAIAKDPERIIVLSKRYVPPQPATATSSAGHAAAAPGFGSWYVTVQLGQEKPREVEVTKRFYDELVVGKEPP